MRLTPHEVAAIKAAAADVFGPTAVVRLFGSRVNDDLRGGDIDLHLEVDEGEQHVEHAARFRWNILKRIEPRKIDLVFQVRQRVMRPIDEIAHAEGVVL